MILNKIFSTISEKFGFAIARREFRSLLRSPIGYILLLSYSFIFAMMFQSGLEHFRQSQEYEHTIAPLAIFFKPSTISILLLLLIPSITMKTICEEKNLGTYSLLLSYPISEAQLILGKFLGVLAYYIILWIPSVLFLLLTSFVGEFDLGQILLLYTHILIICIASILLGILASSLFSNQLAGWSLTVLLLLPLHSYIFFIQDTSPIVITQMPFFLEAWQNACRGVLHSQTLLLYGMVAFVAFYTSVAMVWADRWVAWAGLTRIVRYGLFLACIFPFCLGVAFWYGFVQDYDFMGIIRYIFIFHLVCSFVVLQIFSRYKQIYQRPLKFLFHLTYLYIIASMTIWLGYYYPIQTDVSQSQAFHLDSSITKVLQEKIPMGDTIHAIIFLGYNRQHQHEHTQRDNERYRILSEVFRTVHASFNHARPVCFSYEFLSPTLYDTNVHQLVEQQSQIHNRIASLQNRYGVSGYREVLLLYRNQSYILNDGELFERKLTRQQVPRLWLLWKKIYESGGISEAPPQDMEQAYIRLHDIANLEMLTIFPHPELFQNLIHGIQRILENQNPIIYCTQGQGEYDIQGNLASPNVAYRLINLLKRHNYTIRPLRLANANTIPKDCTALLVLHPEDWNAGSIQTLQDYLEQKQGRVLLSLSPTSQSLDPILHRYCLYKTPAILYRLYQSSFQQKVKKENTFVLDDFGYLPLENILQQFQELENAPDLSQHPFVFSQASPIIPLPQSDENQASRKLAILPIPPNLALTTSSQSNEQLPVNEGNWPLGYLIQGKNDERLIILGTSHYASEEISTQSGLPQILMGSNRWLIPTLLQYLIPQPSKTNIIFPQAYLFEAQQDYFPTYSYWVWTVAGIWPILLAWIFLKRPPKVG